MFITLSLLSFAPLASGATKIDLKHQSANYLKSNFVLTSSKKPLATHLKKIKTDIDFNNTAHVRIQQMYDELPILGATSVVHIPQFTMKQPILATLKTNIKMNGIVYEGIAEDLSTTNSDALSDIQKQKALQEARFAFEKKTGAVNLSYSQETVKTVVYVDAKQKAHYGFLVSFYYDDGNNGAHHPHSIIDADSL